MTAAGAELQKRRVRGRDLTDQERQEWAEDAHQKEQAIKGHIAKGREAAWGLAQAIYEFDQIDGWKALGYEKISHWLADPDITMTTSVYYRARNVWRDLAVQRRIKPARLQALDLTKVDLVLPVINEGEHLTKDVLADVEAMGANDLRVKYLGKPEKSPTSENNGTRTETDAEQVEGMTPVGPEEGTGDQVGNVATSAAPTNGQVDDDEAAEVEDFIEGHESAPKPDDGEEAVGYPKSDEAPETPAGQATDPIVGQASDGAPITQSEVISGWFSGDVEADVSWLMELIAEKPRSRKIETYGQAIAKRYLKARNGR